MNNFRTSTGHLFIECELKKICRFIVQFDVSTGIESWMVSSITKPTYKNGVWSNIEIKLYDYVAPSTTQKIFNLINSFENQNECSFFIHDLDLTGTEISKMQIIIDELNIDFGVCDYTDADGVTVITVDIKPKHVICIY